MRNFAAEKALLLFGAVGVDIGLWVVIVDVGAITVMGRRLF
jgi:hypothetical protein